MLSSDLPTSVSSYCSELRERLEMRVTRVALGGRRWLGAANSSKWANLRVGDGYVLPLQFCIMETLRKESLPHNTCICSHTHKLKCRCLPDLRHPVDFTGGLYVTQMKTWIIKEEYMVNVVLSRKWMLGLHGWTSCSIQYSYNFVENICLNLCVLNQINFCW